MDDLRVICHSGFRGEEYPERVVLFGHERRVTAILESWQSPEGRSFRVRCDDGQVYLLTCLHEEGTWMLE